MSESNRLNGSTKWIDLEFVERERTPHEIIETGIQLHLSGLSLSNTKQYLERLGVERSRTAIHNWIQKADLQPADGASPNRVAVDETAIQIDSDRFWLYAAVDPHTNDFLHVDVFPVQNQQFTLVFLRDLREKHHVDDALFLIDAGGHLTAALSRTSLRFQITRHGNRNAVERIFREVKRRTSSFSNTFRNAEPTAAESWLRAFAVCWNRCLS